jgi:hypothetical protein
MYSSEFIVNTHEPMNTTQSPHVRIDHASHEHLGKIISAFNKAGRKISKARFLSDLILAQLIPNGHTPVRESEAAATAEQVRVEEEI